MVEPGLDEHEWRTEWEQLEPLVIDSPREALPELDRLIEEIMRERGLPTTEEEAFEAADPEIVAEFLEARRITRALDSGADDDPGDVAAAITAYRNLYDFLLEEYRSP
jgi:hypothetical protein